MRHCRLSGSPVLPVDVEVGKAAAGNVHPEAVARLEQVGRRLNRKANFVHGARLHQLRRLEAVAIAGPDDSVGDRKGVAGRVVFAGRIDVDQLDEEVGVGGHRTTRRAQLEGCPPRSYPGTGEASGRPARRDGRRWEARVSRGPGGSPSGSGCRVPFPGTRVRTPVRRRSRSGRRCDRVSRVVGVGGGIGAAAGFRCRQRSVPVEIVFPGRGVDGGPLLAGMPGASMVHPVFFTAPAVTAAHHEHLHRMAELGSLVPLEPAIEPLQLVVEELEIVGWNDARLGAVVGVPVVGIPVGVGPGAGNQVLIASASLEHLQVAVHDGAGVDFVPSGDPHDGNVRIVVEVFVHGQAGPLPELGVVVVVEVELESGVLVPGSHTQRRLPAPPWNP